jgi:hypothetical protein
LGTKLFGAGQLAIGTEDIGAERLFVTGGETYLDGDVTITGNLFVNGNTTTFNANNLTISDSMIFLADNNPADTLDIGFISSFTDAVRYQHTGFIRDASDGTWKLFANVVPEPTTTVDFTNANYGNILVGNIQATYINAGGVRQTTSSSAPSIATVGDQWYDSSTDIVFQYIYDGTNNFWVDISSVALNTNIATIQGTTLSITGNGTVSGSLSTGSINTTANIICSVLDAGSIECTGIVYANSTAQSTSTTTGALEVAGGVGIVGNLNVGDGTLSGGTHRFQGNIVPFSSNTYTLGTNTAWWTITYSKAVQAQYADLAENYSSDSQYEPGTVLVFGGTQEVTQSTTSHDPAIAGVVSTNPAYLMNSGQTGVSVALTGRVPCWVQGPINKGDRVVSSDMPGIAECLNLSKYQPGCIIGKSLETIEHNQIKLIEVVVGRI